VVAVNRQLRFLVALVVGVSVGLATFVALDANAGWMKQECRYQRLEAGKWTTTEARRTIGCFAAKFGVGVETAKDIAYRESRYFARAYNDDGCGGAGCLGLYQHHGTYWPGRLRLADDALRRWDVKKRKWWNPRVMSVTTFVYVRRYGWSAWS
jgi:hypothetical protein